MQSNKEDVMGDKNRTNQSQTSFHSSWHMHTGMSMNRLRFSPVRAWRPAVEENEFCSLEGRREWKRRTGETKGESLRTVFFLEAMLVGLGGKMICPFSLPFLLLSFSLSHSSICASFLEEWCSSKKLLWYTVSNGMDYVNYLIASK